MRKFGFFILILTIYFLFNCRMMHLFEDRDFLTDSSTTLVNPDLTTTSLEFTTTTNPNQIEIAGHWFVANIDLNTSQDGAENGHTYIENTFISYDYTPSGMNIDGNIIEFDNLSCYLIYKIVNSNDSSSIGKFQKVFWEIVAPDKMRLSSTNYSDTLESAQIDTTIIWGPSKIWSREIVTTTTTTPVTTIPSTTTTLSSDIHVSIVINPSTGYTVTFNPPSGGELNKNIGQALFVVCEITDGGATNFKWLLDGDLKQDGIGNTISINSNSLFLGLHYLSVIITKDGKNYSGQMEFSVVNK